MAPIDRDQFGASSSRFDVGMSHITGAQIGDGNSIFLGGRTQIEWPHRVGALVQVADCYQPRAASNALRRMAHSTSFGGGCKVLVGLGGAGKTQLASAFALESWASGALDLLIWITAASREAIVATYAQAAADIVGGEDSDAERAANRLLSWLADTERRWLVVLDDLTNPSHLNRLWPPESPVGQTIVTTRRHDAALTMTGRQIIDIGLFGLDESRNYLTQKFAAHPHLADDVDKLADDLGHLPLALAQAAAYSIDRQLTCNEYCQRLADRKRRLADLLPEPDALPDAHTHTVSATWSLSIDLADRLAPKGFARPLLELMCVLDPNGVPLAVLTSLAALEYIRKCQTSDAVESVKPERARDALYCLQRLSLISVDPQDEARTVRVHGLVQRTTFEQLEDRDCTVRAAADALAEVWPQAERNPALGQALCASAIILNVDQPESLRQPAVHPVLVFVIRSLGQVGLVSQAHALGIQLQAYAARYLGPMHPDTLTVRANVASSLGETGDWAGAAAALEVLVSDCVAVLGAEHVDTLKEVFRVSPCYAV
jgi:NB-ARC domain